MESEELELSFSLNEPIVSREVLLVENESTSSESSNKSSSESYSDGLETDLNQRTVRSNKNPLAINPIKKPYSRPVAIFAILIFIGLIINIYLLWRLTPITLEGTPFPEDKKWQALIIGLAITGVFSIIYIYLILYTAVLYGCNTGGFLFIITILVAILISYVSALAMGDYLGVGFLWTNRNN